MATMDALTKIDLEKPFVLTNIFTVEELEKTPVTIQEKLTNYLDGFIDDYCKQKAAASRLHDCEQKTEDQQLQIEEYERKLQSYIQNVSELRSQLDNISSERTQLLEKSNSYESELAALRSECRAIVDERDSLLNIIDRKNSEQERLQQELRSYQQQLTSAINAKCEAIARLDDVESKEVALDFKERRMEQERTVLQNQIQTLSVDLNRNITELQNIRRENTMQNMHLEARLNEKCVELKIARDHCGQYKESIDQLTQSVQELSTKMLSQNEEANKMMDYYKKEIEAKTKLASLYKSNSEDTDMERNELSAAIIDLKRMLTEASEQYGDLETKLKATICKHEQEIDEKDKDIKRLSDELRHANELLAEMQNETVETAIAKLAPSAAIASRLIRSDMSLTEVYSLYVKSSEELELQKRQNAQLNLQLKTILNELRDNAPIIKKQELEYQKLIESKNVLSHHCDQLNTKKAEIEELIENSQLKINHLERENQKLKRSQSDLSRQVCFLLKEVEQLRIGITAEHDSSYTDNLLTSEDVISKKLVTFGSISEMQESNQKLLLIVRDLSMKLEEAEMFRKESSDQLESDKLQSYVKKVNNMQEILNQQNSTVATLIAKCERYKKLYFEQQKSLQNRTVEDLMDSDAETGNATDDLNETDNKIARSTKNSVDNSEQRITSLEQALASEKEQHKTLKQQYDYYIQEKKNNEKILNEQFDKMKTEVRELTSSNCKLMSTLEHTKEQIKLQQKNIFTYKNQIAALEDRNKNYESTIIKHEQSLQLLKDEVIKAQREQSFAETNYNHQCQENRTLKDAVARLQSEKDGFHREHQNQNLLLNNLEMIKFNLERSELEGRVRLENRLDDALRELAAQRRRFQEEEDKFRESSNDLKRQAESAKQQLADEKVQTEKLRSELVKVREEIVAKASQIDELSKKLQEILTPSKNDNPIKLANKKIRELEIKLEESSLEISSLTTELAKSRQHAEQYYKMSESAEIEIKNLHEVHTAFEATTKEEIANLKNAELYLKSRVSELEAEVQLSEVNEVADKNKTDHINKSQNDLKDALQKLCECNKNLRDLRTENATLADSLNAVETKYANEMVMHSADIQELTKLKAELLKVQDQINELVSERDSAKASYLMVKDSHVASLELVQNEKIELEKRVNNLTTLNSNLHDQIEALASKLSILSQSEKTNMSHTFEPNASFEEKENKSSEQLLQIIKFLRKEKDLAVAKLDIHVAENTRLLSEHTILQKKIDELTGFLQEERSKSETAVVSASKHEEILRKIETLNAITDSNRILREERNAMALRVTELTESISAIENEFFPLQNQNRELALKIEELTIENNSLRTEAVKWRQRANTLLEKSNKNPEEFKRLQMERENLAQMLTNEKDLTRQATEEANALKAEKIRLESQKAALEKQIQSLIDEKKKLSDDSVALKQNHARVLQEVMELKNKLLQQEEGLQKLAHDIELKEAQIHDSKNKEVQIRKIAKRYKDSYMELSTKQAAPAADNSDGPSQETSEVGTLTSAGGDTSTELEQQKNITANLNNVIRTMQEEHEKLRKQYDELRATVDMEEHRKLLLHEANTRIATLMESKNVITQELASTKSKLQSMAHSSDNYNSAIIGIKSQYEGNMLQMEKEFLEQSNTSKETISRLTRENESLQMRINQLSRQLGLQQSTKPSTSSVIITDKGCISETSPRTANVKPLSGSSNVQQSATVTPWRGGETPLASIRPISVQNSRTASVVPTSQHTTSGGTSLSTTSSLSTPSSVGSTQKALVPPQQVHTTDNNSEPMSSPTSSHTDYMPSTSSAVLAVAAIPPMGSAAIAESSQEAESIQQPLQNEPQHLGSSGQQQVVALISPRVEGPTSNVSLSSLALQQNLNNQQPSTSVSTGSALHTAISSHNRRAPSNSNVTTTQAGSSLKIGHKRPRDLESDSSITTEEHGSETSSKRSRAPSHVGEAPIIVTATDSETDVEYQVPTSSQRDQEDDVVIVDSEEEDGVVEADDEPVDNDPENDCYDDSYVPDQEMNENECPCVIESNIQSGIEIDNNEVDLDEGIINQMQCTSGTVNEGNNESSTSGPCVSQPAAATVAHSQQDNHQQSQTISSCNPSTNFSQSGTWQQASPSFSRQATHTTMKQGMEGNFPEGADQKSNATSQSSSTEIVSSPQDSKYEYTETMNAQSNAEEIQVVENEAVEENLEAHDAFFIENKNDGSFSDEAKNSNNINNMENESYNELTEEGDATIDNENHHSSGATQSEIQDIQERQIAVTSELNEGVDGVSSEGEKQLIEEVEEEGREAEATTSPSINTRSKAAKVFTATRRPRGGFNRGSRPTPIIWQDSAGNSRNATSSHQASIPLRGFPNQRSQRARRMRRPTGGNFGNMRYS